MTKGVSLPEALIKVSILPLLIFILFYQKCTESINKIIFDNKRDTLKTSNNKVLVLADPVFNFSLPIEAKLSQFELH